MTSHFHYDVLIVGAGSSGLTLAIDLARRGLSFRLIDKLDTPFHGSRGKGVQPRTLEIAEALGFVDQLTAAGGPYPPRRVYREDGTYSDQVVMENAGSTSAEPFGQTLMIPQFLSEKVMRDRLAELGHAPEFGCELLNFEQSTDGVTATLAGKNGQETVHAKWLIGADGGRSFIRKSLDIEFPGKTLGVRALVADVALEGFSRDHWHCYNISNPNQIMICPLMGTEMFQLQAPIPAEGDFDLSAEGLTEFVRSRSGRPDAVVRSLSWASAYSMNARLAERYREGRVFLVGDSAHAHPPTGGQGLNTSMQDAFNLGWKLASVIEGASDKLLDTYEEERRPVAAGMLGLATRLLDEHKAGKMERGRDVKQLDIGYPETSLRPANSGQTKTLSVGNRAPDAHLRGASGQSHRLFELTAGGHWTLFGNEVDPDFFRPRPGLRVHVIGARGDLVDDLGHFSDAYSLSPGGWVLIRPDGYVAAITDSTDLRALNDFMETVGLSAPVAETV